MLILVGGSLATGCYTVLRHPEADDLVAEESSGRRACADCHVDSDFYHDAFDPWFYGYGGYWAYQDWSDYYFRPWWYRDFWYYDTHPDVGPGVPVETRGQHMWGSGGRRTLTPGSPPNIHGSGPGTSAPGGSSPSGGSAAKPPPSNENEKPAGREDSRSAGPHRGGGRREMGTQKAPQPEPPPQPAPEDDDSDPDGGGSR